jgi:hypothetical protein
MRTNSHGSSKILSTMLREPGNHELIALCWSIGRDLLERGAKGKWGRA